MSHETPQDTHQGYTALDGTYVGILAVPQQPDAPVDLSRCREPARKDALAAAERSFSREFAAIEHRLTHLDNPFADETAALNPALASLTPRYLIDVYRTIFHEPLLREWIDCADADLPLRC